MFRYAPQRYWGSFPLSDNRVSGFLYPAHFTGPWTHPARIHRRFPGNLLPLSCIELLFSVKKREKNTETA
jgi:hypothetical protein